MPHALPQVCLTSSSNVGARSIATLAASAISNARVEPPRLSAIDRAYDSLIVVTQLTVDASSSWRPQHGLILASSAVAVAEDYFRSVLTDTVVVCPLCTKRIEPLETRMEFVLSGSIPDAVRGILDRESFSSKQTIVAWAKKIAGDGLGESRSLALSLDEFERVCHVRHCAMHAGGYVSSRNAQVLDVPVGSWISFAAPTAIHEITAVVTATLRAFNQTLFEVVLSRWIDERQLSGDWNVDKEQFTSLWSVFRSTRDIDSASLSGPPLRRTAYQAYLAIRSAASARSALANRS